MAKALMINVLKYIQNRNLVFEPKTVMSATGASDCTVNQALRTIMKMYPDLLEVRNDVRPRLYVRRMEFDDNMVLKVDQACKEYHRNYKRSRGPKPKKDEIRKWVEDTNRTTQKTPDAPSESGNTLENLLLSLARTIKEGSDRPERFYGKISIGDINVDFDVMVEASKKE